MPGPAPQPRVLKLLRGNPGHRRLRPEVEPAIAPVVPNAPDFLTDEALAEWNRLGARVACAWPVANRRRQHIRGLLHGLRARWRSAELVLRDMAKRNAITHGLLIRTVEGTPRRNPVVKIAADAAIDMIKFAGEFGLTPVARSRLAAGIGGSPDGGKFDGLLA